MWLVETVFKSLRKNHVGRLIFWNGHSKSGQKIGFVNVFDLCSKFCRSFWISFLSSSSLKHEDLDFEHERFWKIMCKNIERLQGLSHGAQIRKSLEIPHVVVV